MHRKTIDSDMITKYIEATVKHHRIDETNKDRAKWQTRYLAHQ